jgi:AcrR family transcriptional regulator
MAKTPGDPRGTRERVLRSAETLFAERGFEIVSLRDITGAADANVAAVNYHFGSKEKLIDAVIERHVVPINEERVELLNRFEAKCVESPLPVDKVLKAFLWPMLRHITSGEMSEELFGKFMGRLIGERGYRLPESVRPLFRMMAARFTSALRRAVPQLSEEEALWRMHFSFGVMSNTLTHGDTLREISGGRAGNPSIEKIFEEIIEFCAAGIEAVKKES